MLLPNDAKQIVRSHFLCVLILPEVGDGSEWVPGGSVSVHTMECPELCLLCTPQQFKVLLALIQTPVPASRCG